MKRIWAYRAVVFLSAFLLFQIQPMTSKALLPGFGGSYLVWGACMVFYQAMLLAGYLYAHLMQRWVGVGRYSRLHAILLVTPFFLFPFHFERFQEAAGSLPLAAAVFVRLLGSVGLPLLTLSTTSVLLQRWLSVSDLPESENPYVLYGASNLGSMLALLSYPAAVEPFLPLVRQGYVWWGGYAVMAALHLFCIPPRAAAERAREAGAAPVPAAQAASWFFLAAAAVSLLLAVTNVITFDVASVPLLWVLPLSVYLLTFVLTFKRRPWFPDAVRRLFPWIVVAGILVQLLSRLRLGLPGGVAIAIHVLVLFVACVNGHGRLVASRPADARHLTTFYLLLAAGGVAGGLLVSWVAPLVSASLIEYPLALAAVAGALAFSGRGAGAGGGRGWAGATAGVLTAAVALTVVPWAAGLRLGTDGPWGGAVFVLVAVPVVLVLRAAARRPARLALVTVTVAVAMNWTEDLACGASAVKRHRNYYGMYRVFDRDNLRYLQHGTTQHGRQYLSGPRRETPLAYFHPSTPAAGVLTSPRFAFRRIGMVGLGTGALAAYAGSGQTFTVYELDPDNLPIAQQEFSYLSLAQSRGADLRFVFGDGRVALRAEPDRSLDLLIIDAFNSGSIPVHLLTVEAFRTYTRVLTARGILLLHVSNKVLDLEPVVYSNARALGLSACEKSNEAGRPPDAEYTYWMAVSSDPERVGLLVNRLGWRRRESGADDLPAPWTDQYSNILGAMF